ncbi:hypothetical protein HMPREF0201_04727 [Cedecea davisae DSM 4568]|uniref:Uncharacterized protein n=1 Tax=Cedecea davisae DSM 4568 TaxID=566551 RepID=S3IYB9_9ENTR|nr:hypothetical protein HMPREF0201_04727 [Cedecea davisae DSM 4568]
MCWGFYVFNLSFAITFPLFGLKAMRIAPGWCAPGFSLSA